MGEFEGDVGVRVRRHATWNMERHLVTRRDPGMETHAACSPRCLFSPLLVVGSVLVVSPYCRGLNPSGLLLSVSYRRSQYSPRPGNHRRRFSWTCRPARSQGGRRVHAVRSLLRPVTLPGPLALCPSPSSSHHHSRIPSLTPSTAVCALPRLLTLRSARLTRLISHDKHDIT